MQHYSRKRQFKNFDNRVNNGLGEALNLPNYGNGINNPLLNAGIMINNTSPQLLTLNWIELTYFYKQNGFIQTAINQIVDDAFRNDGLIIDSKTLSTNELEELKQALIDNGDIDAIMDCIRWGQLYGGGVLIANTSQNFSAPLNKKILKGGKLKFLASDRWQCQSNGESPELTKTFTFCDTLDSVRKAGVIIDTSRVATFSGVKAPYQLRAMLQGWGLSIFEAIIPPLTQYLKAMNVTLELLDEAKIDVLKIFKLSNTLLSPNGERQIRKRLALVTDNKNYKSSIAMDKDDEYEQKQISFSGLPDMIVQIQYLVCAALKRPYSKIFGKGSSGFSSGEDDLENYNTIVDSEIRRPATNLIKWVVNLRCLQLFGRELTDFRPRWKPLRVMTEKEQADVNSKKLADYLALLEHQVITPKQVAQKLTEDGYILFSDEEIENISDEFAPDMEDSIKEDLIA